MHSTLRRSIVVLGMVVSLSACVDLIDDPVGGGPASEPASTSTATSDGSLDGTVSSSPMSPSTALLASTSSSAPSDIWRVAEEHDGLGLVALGPDAIVPAYAVGSARAAIDSSGCFGLQNENGVFQSVVWPWGTNVSSADGGMTLASGVQLRRDTIIQYGGGLLPSETDPEMTCASQTGVELVALTVEVIPSQS